MSYSIDTTEPNVWITYRNPIGAGVAAVFRSLFRLRSEGIIKMNIDRLDTHEYTKFIYSQIESCVTMFVILTPSSLDSAVTAHKTGQTNYEPFLLDRYGAKCVERSALGAAFVASVVPAWQKCWSAALERSAEAQRLSAALERSAGAQRWSAALERSA